MRACMRFFVKSFVIGLYRAMCVVLPVNKKRIVFDSSLGKSYSGNPRHILNISWKMDTRKNGSVRGFTRKRRIRSPGTDTSSAMAGCAICTIWRRRKCGYLTAASHRGSSRERTAITSRPGMGRR